MMSDSIDNIYTKQLAATKGQFKFDQQVAKVFADMISRSVPGYLQILEMLPTLTRQFSFDRHAYYDLGCSLGAGMLAMSQGLDCKHAKLIGIDNSSAMIEQASANLSTIKNPAVQLILQDVMDTEIHQAGMVLMNFTLQFIPLEQRAALIARIFNGLCQGGALILSEKIIFDDEKTNRALINIHHQYKADQGYSELEISQKRDAIENVLVPETLNTHEERLKQAGFSVVTPWVQNLQFLSILAIK